jgi:hypothetical protein
MWWHSKFGSSLCKIRWEKHPRAFVKLIEGSEIYNFPIQHLVHFSCKFWSILLSNRAGWNSVTSCRDVAPAKAPRAPPRAPRCRTAVRSRTRVPRRACDPRSEHHNPRDAPPRHV